MTTAGYDNSLYLDTDQDVYKLSLRDVWDMCRDKVEGLPEFGMLRLAVLTAEPGEQLVLSAQWGMGFRFDALVKRAGPPS